MADETTDIDAGTLWWLREELRRREQEIINNLLQAPDYPPLPPCPNCAARPNAIRHTDDLVAFDPCGHQFRITEDVKMDLRP